jgi:hypothetical protein
VANTRQRPFCTQRKKTGTGRQMDRMAVPDSLMSPYREGNPVLPALNPATSLTI